MDDDERLSAFRAFTEKCKKHRNAAIEDMSSASIRQVWTPAAENFFGRVSADTLHALMLDLTGTDPQGSGFKAFRAQKKAAQTLSLEKLFSDPDYQRVWGLAGETKARIDAWVPDCF